MVKEFRRSKFVLSALFLAFCSTDGFSIQCKKFDGTDYTVQPKTITITNNSEGKIYPVLATSSNAVNEWIQACFRTAEPNPTAKVYKVFINENRGLESGQSVTLTLPLYSELKESGFDKYITWWNGGRVVIADGNRKLDEANDADTKLNAMPEGLECKGENSQCDLTVYASNSQFPEDIPAQLTEYTFGGVNPPPGESLRILKPENVGYNISYVDHVYLPVAIGPKGNRYIGYTGSVQSVGTFRSHIKKFLAKGGIGEGWPVYNMAELKIPGAYNVFALRKGRLNKASNPPVQPADGSDPLVLTVLQCLEGQCTDKEKKKPYGKSVQDMQNLWSACFPAPNQFYITLSDKTVECPPNIKKDLQQIHQFFQENYNNYKAMWDRKECRDPGVKTRIPFDASQAIKHIYGWVPFNEGCGADKNSLAGDTDASKARHTKMQEIYINDLQYNYKDSSSNQTLFNPYVQLVHSADYLDMDSYAFSVDDAVGFMSELGDGLNITVGGAKGLQNEDRFSYKTGFVLGLGTPLALVNKPVPLLKSYGVCVFNDEDNNPHCDKVKQDVLLPTYPQISGFRVGTVKEYPIKIEFTDADDNLYSLVVKKDFSNFSPSNKGDIIEKDSCSVKDKNGQEVSKSKDWCANANPNQQTENGISKNYISFPVPVNYMP